MQTKKHACMAREDKGILRVHWACAYRTVQFQVNYSVYTQKFYYLTKLVQLLDIQLCQTLTGLTYLNVFKNPVLFSPMEKIEFLELHANILTMWACNHPILCQNNQGEQVICWTCVFIKLNQLFNYSHISFPDLWLCISKFKSHNEWNELNVLCFLFCFSICQ